MSFEEWELDRAEIFEALAKGEIDEVEAYEMLAEVGPVPSEETIEEVVEAGEEGEEEEEFEYETLPEWVTLHHEGGKYVGSFSDANDAIAWASQFPGVFVVVYNEDTEEFDVVRDYGDDDAVPAMAA